MPNGNEASLMTLDQIRDAMIARGMGTSGLTQQAITRAGLPSLGSAIQESQAARQEAARKQQEAITSQSLKNMADLRRNQFKITSAKFDPNQPFIVGSTPASNLGEGGPVVAYRTAQGYQLKTLSGDEAKQAQNLQGFQGQLPKLTSLFFPGQTRLKTLSDLQNALAMQFSTNPSDVLQKFKELGGQ